MELRILLRLGFRLDLADTRADEFFAIMLLEEEGDRVEREPTSRSV